MPDPDKTIEKDHELHDDDSLAAGLRPAQTATDILATARCPARQQRDRE
jgi:hypothetical protein